MLDKINPFDKAAAGARKCFYLAGLFSFGVNLLMLTVPLYMISVFDRVISSRSEETLVYLTLIAIFALAIMGALDLIRSQLLVRLGFWADHTLSPSIFTGILEQSGVNQRATTRMLSYVHDIRSFLGSSSILQAMDAPWLPFYIIVLWILHPVVGLLGTAGAAILLALALYNEIATRQVYRKAGELQSRSRQEADSSIRNSEVISALGMKGNIVARWMTSYIDALQTSQKGNITSRSTLAIAKTFRFVLQIGVLGVGAYFVLQREFTPGTMIAGSILLARALAPVENAIDTWKSLSNAREAYGQLKTFFAAVAEHQSDTRLNLPPPQGHLNIENVVYAYPSTNHAIIRGVNFQINPGEIVALIGPSGAGKSTMARLLVGILRPLGGAVRLDDIELTNWPREDLGPYIGYLPQDVELFPGTIAENIGRFAKFDSEAVIMAARTAGVHELIARMPQAYDTQIGERGQVLSGGQRQRIGLARALYGLPNLVVLDEPNANLDSEGEQNLLQVIANLKNQGITVIFIAHRPNMLQSADRIILMREGRVEDDGLRDDILPRVTRPRSVPNALK